MGKWLFLAVVAATTAASPACRANDQLFIFDEDPRWLGITTEKPIRVILSDQVKDGCWTSSLATKNSASLELTRSGFKIDDDKSFMPITIRLVATGYYSGGQCVAIYDTTVFHIGTSEYGISGHNITSLRLSPIWSSKGVISGPKNTFSTRLKERFTESVQEFLLEIQKQKEIVRKTAVESASHVNKKEGIEAHPSRDFWINYKP